MNVKRHIEAIMRGETDAGPAWIPSALSAVAFLYAAGVKLRKSAYAKSWLKTRRLDCMVISVGNLTLGGTGKTPMTIYLARLLRSYGHRVVVINRGYKGTAQERGGVVSDGKVVSMQASACGDEAFMMAGSLKNVPVLVGRDRHAVGKKAIELFNPQVILLDDAFQHVRLYRDLDLVLLDAEKPFGNGRLFPRGTLREETAALNRSSAVVLTRADGDTARQADAVGRIAPGKPVFQSRHQPFIAHVIPGKRDAGSAIRPAEESGSLQILRGRSGYLFSGIADNTRFYRTVEAAGNRVCGASFFEDHHRYAPRELETIIESAIESRAGLIVTTEKDLSRIPPGVEWPVDLVAVGVEIHFPDDTFDRYIRQRLEPLG
ncbi:MAG: tetraacyldisaccharide 4'-kinase [Deltaproteobacteria bacterium]|nr:tetraacyldisaccharide 4'-kinase [Deltaproteobacteria bacterium]